MARGQSILLFYKSGALLLQALSRGLKLRLPASMTYGRLRVSLGQSSVHGIGALRAGCPAYELLHGFRGVKAQLFESGTVGCPSVDQAIAGDFRVLIRRRTPSLSFLQFCLTLTLSLLRSLELRLLGSEDCMALFQMPDALAALIRSLPQGSCSGCKLRRRKFREPGGAKFCNRVAGELCCRSSGFGFRGTSRTGKLQLAFRGIMALNRLTTALFFPRQM